MVNIKNSEKCKGRRESIKNATPSWLSDEDKLHIDRFYEVSAAMSVGEIKHEVDHIVPLNHPLVCGLHIPRNLQIITYDKNKEKGNDIHIEPMDGAITIDQIEQNLSIRSKGKFVKGVSGNPNGRPKGTGKNQMAEEQQALLDSIVEEANGDAVVFQKLVLKNGHKLKLDLHTLMKLAKELSVYQTPKKASIEQKTESVSTYVLQYGFDQQQIEDQTVDITPEGDENE